MTIGLPELLRSGLDSKRALVAGASSGIGRACASALAQAGASVTVAMSAASTVRTPLTEQTFDRPNASRSSRRRSSSAARAQWKI